MAPEILQDQDFEKSVDWWSLGIIIFQMLTGEFPFKGSGKELLQSIINAEFTIIRNISDLAFDLI